jgi:hypothetical protein
VSLFDTEDPAATQRFWTHQAGQRAPIITHDAHAGQRSRHGLLDHDRWSPLDIRLRSNVSIPADTVYATFEPTTWSSAAKITLRDHLRSRPSRFTSRGSAR